MTQSQPPSSTSAANTIQPEPVPVPALPPLYVPRIPYMPHSVAGNLPSGLAPPYVPRFDGANPSSVPSSGTSPSTVWGTPASTPQPSAVNYPTATPTATVPAVSGWANYVATSLAPHPSLSTPLPVLPVASAVGGWANYQAPFSSVPPAATLPAYVSYSAPVMPTNAPAPPSSLLDELALAPYRSEVMASINNYPTTLAVFNTGTGKSLSIPAWVAAQQQVCWCTGPTRTAVWGLARRQREIQTQLFAARHASLPSTYVGSAADRIIDYVSRTTHQRNDNYVPRSGAPSLIVYMTEGHLFNLLLRECFTDEGKPRAFTHCDVLMVDEIHLGLLYGSIIVAIVQYLRRLGLQTPRLVAASATPVALPIEPPPHIVRGEVWQHTIAPPHYITTSLQSKKILETTAAVVARLHMSKELTAGDILVFVASKAEIDQLFRLTAAAISAAATVAPAGRVTTSSYLLLAAHGSLRAEEIAPIFEDHPGKRKIIIATNVAETSLTIPNISMVVDTMRAKIAGKSSTGGTSLTTQYISQAAAEQRKGRTGRTRNGEVYRMCTEEFFNNLLPQQEPELLRVHIYHLYLTIAERLPDPAVLLGQVPPADIIETQAELVRLGALAPCSKGDSLTTSMMVTRAGSFMARFTMGVRTACFLWSWINGLTATALDARTPPGAGLQAGLITTSGSQPHLPSVSSDVTSTLGPVDSYASALFHPGHPLPLSPPEWIQFDAVLANLVSPLSVGSILDFYPSDGAVLAHVARIFHHAAIRTIEPRYRFRPALVRNVSNLAAIVRRAQVSVSAHDVLARAALQEANAVDLVTINGLNPHPLGLMSSVTKLANNASGSTSTDTTEAVAEIGYLVGSLIGLGVSNRVVLLINVDLVPLVTAHAHKRASVRVDQPRPVGHNLVLVLFNYTGHTRSLVNRPAPRWPPLADGFDTYTGLVTACLVEASPLHFIESKTKDETPADYRARALQAKMSVFRHVLGPDDLTSVLNIWRLFQTHFGPRALKIGRSNIRPGEDEGVFVTIGEREFRTWCRDHHIQQTKMRELLSNLRSGIESLRLHLTAVIVGRGHADVEYLSNKYTPFLGTIQQHTEVVHLTSLLMHDIYAPAIATLNNRGSYVTRHGMSCTILIDMLNTFTLNPPSRLIILSSVVNDNVLLINFAIPDVVDAADDETDTRVPSPTQTGKGTQLSLSSATLPQERTTTNTRRLAAASTDTLLSGPNSQDDSSTGNKLRLVRRIHTRETVPNLYAIHPYQLLAGQAMTTDVGARAAAAAELLRRSTEPRENPEIGYPYQIQFTLPTSTLFRALQDFDVQNVYNHASFSLDDYRAQQDKFRSTLFRRTSVLIVSPVSYETTINALTNHYSERLRNLAVVDEFLSPAELWDSLSYREALFRELIDFKLPLLTPATLHHHIFHRPSTPELRAARHYAPLARAAAGFRLTWAKALLSYIIPPAELAHKRWLDMSVGWGDRLLAAISLNMVYEGWDPYTALQSGHDAIIRTFGDSHRQRVHYEPFENAVLTTNYDVALISPPLPNEIYVRDGVDSVHQSRVIYPEPEDWFERFLLVSLRKIWTALGVGGYLMLHLYDTPVVTVTERTLLVISLFPGAQYHGVIGVREPIYTDSTRGNHGGQIHPVWVWRKTDQIEQELHLVTAHTPAPTFVVSDSASAVHPQPWSAAESPLSALSSSSTVASAAMPSGTIVSGRGRGNRRR